MPSHRFSSSTHSITTFFFIFLVDFLRISSADEQVNDIEMYNNCSTVKFECGDKPGSSNITYPFWGNNRPSYCGHPGYKLDCQNGFTQYESLSTKYRVLEINEENKTMRIAEVEFLDDACPTKFSNVSQNFNLFSFPGVLELNLFYGCPNFDMLPGNLSQYKFKCQRNSSNRRDGAYFVPPTNVMAQELTEVFSECDMNIRVPIMGSDSNRLMSNPELLNPILRGGFQLDYSSADASNFTFCDRCFASGGQCGFNYPLNHHTCFCSNRTTNGQTFCGATAATQGRDRNKKRNKIAIGAGAGLGSFILACLAFLFFYIRCRKNRRLESGRKKKKSKSLLSDADNPSTESSSDPNMLGENPDFKIFHFEQLLIATNDFNESTKIGRGGFGSVYKGELPDGQVIAIKRLSKSSGQGSQEFKNEVVVISKLQHRNLVRLLGCCTAGEEKILIYEYMPNNSLDTYLFVSDPTKRGLLDWRKRFQIIEGISRGILYLHRDSRLKVIHRDLKPSNVLLDEELNPKISDFGMARIFGSSELQANTNRVVGTYGYMSPEYAMEGQFSEKSDVFSFGVLLLEIVSGRRNTSFYNHDQSLSLLKYAWLLWNENKILTLIEPMVSEQPHCKLEIVRCIHVGLLCVQEFAKDRPTMSTTLSMLTSEIATLPTPKQPAFTEKLSSSHSSSYEHKTFSVNTITLTSVGGR